MMVNWNSKLSEEMAMLLNALLKMMESRLKKKCKFPGVKISLPSLTEKDRTFLKMAAKNEIDFIAHSFVRSKQDVLDVQAVLD